MDELIVLCLVRDGRPYIRSFVDHYSGLGARHLVFLDNGSTDGTVDLLRDYDNVTVLRTGLPFKEYQISMKQYLIERFGRGRWSLFVDVDEFFDYPFSGIVDLRALLGYLSRNSYTAVVAHMLDMFPEDPISDIGGDVDEPFREQHRFYDVSNIRMWNYWDRPFVSGAGNTLTNDRIRVLSDGILKTVFDQRTPLTKHPLVFFDGETKPMDGSSHTVSNAEIADLTCVLLHYKFVGHFYENIRRAVREENYMKDSQKHKKYLRALEQNPQLLLKRDTARELGSVDELVESGILMVSEDYLALAEEEQSKDKLTPPPDGRELKEKYLRGRAQADGVYVSQLEGRIEELQNALSKARRRARGSERANRELRKQMHEIQSSRSRRLLDKISRLRARVLGN